MTYDHDVMDFSSLAIPEAYCEFPNTDTALQNGLKYIYVVWSRRSFFFLLNSFIFTLACIFPAQNRYYGYKGRTGIKGE